MQQKWKKILIKQRKISIFLLYTHQVRRQFFHIAELIHFGVGDACCTVRRQMSAK